MCIRDSLKSGALSGKYTRQNAGQVTADRGARVPLDEKTYALVDELEVIAKAHETNVAAVALAWVQAQPGVTSTIIGARRLAQLEDNVKALDVEPVSYTHLDVYKRQCRRRLVEKPHLPSTGKPRVALVAGLRDKEQRRGHASSRAMGNGPGVALVWQKRQCR